jgi:Uma2 family endonuclease
MSVQQIAEPYITEEEYIRRERNAETRSEYFQGRIYARACTAPPHNVICSNAIYEMGIRLRAKPCIIYTSDQRVRIEATGLNTYPDVSIVCGESLFAAVDDIALINPMLIVEVLSPATANYDRTTKFGHYKTISAFADYLLIHSDRVRVEHFSRNEQNVWTHTVATSLEGELPIPNLDITCSVAELYHNLKLPVLNLLHDPPEPTTL